MPTRDQRLVEVGKTGCDGTARTSTTHDEDPYPATEQFTVNGVSLHGSLLLAAVDKLPQGLFGVRQKLSREMIFAVCQAQPQACETLGVSGQPHRAGGMGEGTGKEGGLPLGDAVGRHLLRYPHRAGAYQASRTLRVPVGCGLERRVRNGSGI